MIGHALGMVAGDMAMTPRFRSSGVSCSSVLSAPRSLNEAVNCRFSNLIQISALAMRDSVSLLRQGVCTTAPPMRAAASWTSSSVTGRDDITPPAGGRSSRACVPGADHGQETTARRCKGRARGVAAVQRVDRRVAAARDLFGGLGAEIGHHGDAVAVAAQQIVQALVGAHVRHVIEREGDVARPHMGDAMPSSCGKRSIMYW